MSHFLYFKNDNGAYRYCTGPTETGGQAPKYYSSTSDHLSGAVANEVRSEGADSYAVYQKVGVVKKVSKPGTEIPFAVGQTVKTTSGTEYTIVFIGEGPYPIITVRPNHFNKQPVVDKWSINGASADGGWKLLKNRTSDTSSVEFVSVAD